MSTAVRSFALAIIVGQFLADRTWATAGAALLGLAVVGAACSATELRAARGRAPWVSVPEGVMVGLLLGLTGGASQALLLYLVVPPVVAGITSGFLVTVNSWLAMGLALAASAGADGAPTQVADRLAPAALWLAVGLGAGLLASHQTRSRRRLEEAQAPYAAAYRLVGQLHTLADELPMDLDVSTHVEALLETLATVTAGSPAEVWVSTARDLEVIGASAVVGPDAPAAARRSLETGCSTELAGCLALPLRAGQHVFGAVVVPDGSVAGRVAAAELQRRLDEQAIGLVTALMVADVRTTATTEERRRLARDMHDGLAQRVVALGYLADEISSTAGTPEVDAAAEQLRSEVTSLVGDLRHAMFDLRHDVGGERSLSGALADYVRQLGSHSALRVHLTLDERGPALSDRAMAEVLRIAQEAIGNAHRHAHAINVWVSLTTTSAGFRLVVEDDGIGGATPRDGHYGLHTMRERADQIHADLEVGGRHDGGTVVTLRSRTRHETKGEHRHDDRLARR